jgi:hypothetical protein
MLTLHIHTHCQVAPANTQAKTLERVCLPKRTTDRQTDKEKEALGGNRRWQPITHSNINQNTCM